MRILITSLLLLTVFNACTSVERKDEKEQIDVSGNWNDTDSRLVAEEMIKDSSEQVWVHTFKATQKRKPVIIVGNTRNNTSEHINTETFTKELERAFINSGKIRIVADALQRPEVRAEVSQMQGQVRPETLKSLKKETGADFILVGVVNDIVDQEKGKKVQFYQINLEIIELQSHEKVWIGQKKIKKLVKKSRFIF